jgi:hypothetical protein
MQQFFYGRLFTVTSRVAGDAGFYVKSLKNLPKISEIKPWGIFPSFSLSALCAQNFFAELCICDRNAIMSAKHGLPFGLGGFGGYDMRKMQKKTRLRPPCAPTIPNAAGRHCRCFGAAVFAVSFAALFTAACGAEPCAETAYEAYVSIAEAFGASEDAAGDAQYDVGVEIEMTLDYGGERFDTSVTGSAKMIRASGTERHELSLDLGEYGRMELFGDGEDIYCELNGTQQYMGPGDFRAQIAGTAALPWFEEASVLSSAYEPGGDGRAGTLVVNGADVTDFVKKLLGEDIDAFGGGNIKVGDVGLTFTESRSGKPQKLEMTVEAEAPGRNAGVFARYTYSFKKLGSGVKIAEIPKRD